MSNVQRPLNSSYRKARAEQAANQERQRIFVAEHFRQSVAFEPTGAMGVPGPAQKPIEQPKSTGHDPEAYGASPDDLKA
jgi:hypothetical protein